jgi:hypothetical protein
MVVPGAAYAKKYAPQKQFRAKEKNVTESRKISALNAGPAAVCVPAARFRTPPVRYAKKKRKWNGESRILFINNVLPVGFVWTRVLRVVSGWSQTKRKNMRGRIQSWRIQRNAWDAAFAKMIVRRMRLRCRQMAAAHSLF